MSRPCKVISSQSRHNTKAEIEERQQAEESIRGKNDKIKQAPQNLTNSQVEIYNFIVNELADTEILNNLDVFILITCCRAVDRLNYIESAIDKNLSAVLSNKLMSAKDKYTKDLYRCCNELSLSPQSRAKLGSLALANKEKREDPVLQALREDDED
ncbi:P27 family phage terminase small subunit [Vallitalea guaymasensis]|uniref:P27 family phage terminase small subunit n=1 Tax=Vallitalea guaymasensis TaxID=1185412 RepID=UPI000DE2D324|nr:P27 family phage terminase small subunit [Vallitalea guaymasensis]